jgi:hypothetical protein
VEAHRRSKAPRMTRTARSFPRCAAFECRSGGCRTGATAQCNSAGGRPAADRPAGRPRRPVGGTKPRDVPLREAPNDARNCEWRRSIPAVPEEGGWQACRQAQVEAPAAAAGSDSDAAQLHRRVGVEWPRGRHADAVATNAVDTCGRPPRGAGGGRSRLWPGHFGGACPAALARTEDQSGPNAMAALRQR